MANQKGPPPAPLHPNVARKLLDLLSSDDDFRDLFQRDAHAALVQAGYAAPAGTDPSIASALSGGDCIQLDSGATLASKEQIAQDRTKLERSLSMIQGFDKASDFEAT
jgi:putative modified peptide